MRLELDIHKKIGDFSLDLSLSSNAKRIGILGGSGSGKSMTLKCIAGIESPDRGRILWDGRVLYDRSLNVALKPQQRKVGYLFQNYALFPNMTVEDNIRCGIRPGNKGPDVNAYLDKYGLTGLRKRFPHELSGGQQQRVALSRIMASQPDLVLLDEPFSALDSYLKESIRRQTIDVIEDAGISTIIVSHDIDELYSMSEEIFIIHNGKLLTGGSREKVFGDPGSVKAAELTDCRNFSEISVTGKRTVLASDWGAELVTERGPIEDISHIGYRAGDFRPLWHDDPIQPNTLDVRFDYEEVLPFNRILYFTALNGKEGCRICWIPGPHDMDEIRVRGIPDRLRILTEKILWLR